MEFLGPDHGTREGGGELLGGFPIHPSACASLLEGKWGVPHPDVAPTKHELHAWHGVHNSHHTPGHAERVPIFLIFLFLNGVSGDAGWGMQVIARRCVRGWARPAWALDPPEAGWWAASAARKPLPRRDAAGQDCRFPSSRHLATAAEEFDVIAQDVGLVRIDGWVRWGPVLERVSGR